MSYICDNCMKKIEGDISFCQDCGKYMCSECSTTIHSFKAFRDHEVETIASPEGGSAGAGEEAASELCTYHKDVCARLFCEDCKELCCYHCICDGGKHSQHKVALSKDAYEEKKSGLSKAADRLADLLKASQLGKELLESEISGSKRAKESVLKEASAAVDRVSELIKQRAAELEQNVNEEAESFKTSIDALTADVNKLRADVSSSVANLDSKDVLTKKFLVVRESGRVEKSTAGLIARNKEILSKIADLSETIDFVTCVSPALLAAKTDAEVEAQLKSIGRVSKGNRKVSLEKSKPVIKVIKPKPASTLGSTAAAAAAAQPEEEKKEEGGEKKKRPPREVSFSWATSISPVLKDIVELGGEDAVYILETKTWSGKKCNKPAEFTLAYQGKETEYLMKGFEDATGEARLAVGHPSGTYRIWESKEQRFGGLGGTYDGVFKDSLNVEFLDGAEHRVVQRDPSGRSHATVVGDEPLLMGDVNVFYLHVRETDRGNNGMSVGVAPIDIDTDPSHENREECGWYFNFYEEKLYSGPPQNYRGKSYARRNDVGTGDIVRVTFDTTGPKGVLSFAVNSDDFGVAFDDIPLDKPIVPAVYFYGRGECIELCGSDFTLPEKWDEAEDGADLARLPPQSAWKECPSSISRESLRYVLPDSSNRRVAKKTDVSGSIYCTMIGDTPIPTGTASYWKISIRSAFGSNGEEVFSGVVPTDISQNEEKNYKVCGWYIRWGRGSLYSGPPQNYKNRAYTKSQRANSGSTMGHILDTTEGVGKLSFIVNGLNSGVAYEDIPLDKPLVPAVLLHFAGDTVELVL